MMLETIKRDWKGVLVQSVVYAVVLIALLIVATAATGGFARESEAVKYQRAIACELAVPVTDSGRDPALVSYCFTVQGLPAPTFAP